MKILFNDVMQNSGAPSALKSPALSDTFTITGDSVQINFNEPVAINCIGIGNYVPGKGKNGDITIITKRNLIYGGNAGTRIFDKGIDGGQSDTKPNEYQKSITGGAAIVYDYRTSICENEFYFLHTFKYSEYTGDGLYMFNKDTAKVRSIIVITPGATIGRLALGIAVDVPTSVVKEPGINSTARPRRTLSGQVISGAGGYNYRTLSLDSRYKIGEEALKEIEKGRKYIGMGYPFFIDLMAEEYKLPFDKLYAVEKNQRSMSFEGRINQYLFSKHWEFKEVF